MTLFYSGGSVTATKGLLDYLFPLWVPSWLARGDSGVGRRPFGSRQRDNRAAGEQMTLTLDTGKDYTVRITGTHKRFLQTILSEVQEGKVLRVVSERGAKYGPHQASIISVGP